MGSNTVSPLLLFDPQVQIPLSVSPTHRYIRGIAIRGGSKVYRCVGLVRRMFVRGIVDGDVGSLPPMRDLDRSLLPRL